MSCLKIVPEPYLNPDALDVLIHHYVFRKAKLIGGLSVDPYHAAEQMHLVKELWGQTGGKQLRHFILSFNDKESSLVFDPSSLLMGSYGVCEYYSNEFQIVFGIHRGRTWHIHFVMNTVSFLTGKRCPNKESDDIALKHHILTMPYFLPTEHIEIYYK